MFKIDLHTHSSHSHDGGVSAVQYEKVLSTGLLDMVAITDHNEIDFALGMHAQLGDKIIVGEEIMTTHGEIIGLFLTKRIPANLTPIETVREITAQGGLVYIPHPFETFRKGLDPKTLEEITDHVDILEVCNGRAFLQNRSAQAVVWARLNAVVSAASSDAHGIKGLGKTYSNVRELPTKDTLKALLATGVLATGHPSLQALLYPKYHKIRKKLGKRK